MSVSITVQDLRVVFSSISRNEEHIQKPASLTCERAVAPPQIARMAAEHATNDQVVCIKELCDESERLAEAGEDYSAADTAFHNAIAESSGNLVVPRLMGVLKASVPLFIDVTGKKLVEETSACTAMWPTPSPRAIPPPRTTRCICTWCITAT